MLFSKSFWRAMAPASPLWLRLWGQLKGMKMVQKSQDGGRAWDACLLVVAIPPAGGRVDPFVWGGRLVAEDDSGVCGFS